MSDQPVNVCRRCIAWQRKLEGQGLCYSHDQPTVPTPTREDDTCPNWSAKIVRAEDGK